MKRNILKGILNYFFQGLLFIAPVVITAWALAELFTFINGILQGYIDEWIGISIPGLGLLLLLVAITLIGLLGSTLFFRQIISYFDHLMVRAPLIKIIYTAVKDLVSAFVGQKKRFSEPVLVRISKDSDLEKIGFVTNWDLGILGQPNEKVAVYLPHSYAWSGNLFVAPAANIKPIKASPTEVMKFVISAGVTNLEEKQDER
jgi:uncharacterized membrane protein